MAELLRLQQKNQLPYDVTVGDTTDLLVEESKSSLRMQLLGNFDEEDAKPHLKLVGELNSSMQKRDRRIKFEARRLLDYPETMHPSFQHPKIINQAQNHAGRLSSKRLHALKCWAHKQWCWRWSPRSCKASGCHRKGPSSICPPSSLVKWLLGSPKLVLD